MRHHEHYFHKAFGHHHEHGRDRYSPHESDSESDRHSGWGHRHWHRREGLGGHLLERLYAHLHRHAMGRHHAHEGGRSGFGGFGGMGGFGDGDGLTRGRKFTSQDLQLLLLALLAEKPAHGYELIKALEERSNGFYAPSPGMVYPALTYLEELGHVTATLEGNRKSYALAQAGQEFLAVNRERADMMLAKLEHIARKMDSIRRAYSGEEGSEGGEENGTWVPELQEARRALKHALYQRSDASLEEQKRIAGLLIETARAILRI